MSEDLPGTSKHDDLDVKNFYYYVKIILINESFSAYKTNLQIK